MICPHCSVAFSETWVHWGIGADSKFANNDIQAAFCPECKEPTIRMRRTALASQQPSPDDQFVSLFPRHAAVKTAPEVPEPYATKFRQATNIIADSPEASAAVSRKLLQTLLREYAKVKPADLHAEIQEVLDSKQLPSHLAEALDAVRNIGNFGTHPIKSKQTGNVVEVEPGEAEWSLDVLEGLFDFYMVQPTILAQRKAALNAKLTAAGKPPMKTP